MQELENKVTGFMKYHVFDTITQPLLYLEFGCQFHGGCTCSESNYWHYVDI